MLFNDFKLEQASKTDKLYNILLCASVGLALSLGGASVSAQAIPGYSPKPKAVDSVDVSPKPSKGKTKGPVPGPTLKRDAELDFPMFYVADLVLEGKTGMWLLDSLGDTLEKISSRPGFPSWASDGTRFVCIDPRKKLKILAINDPMGGLVINLPDPALRPEMPAWSPTDELIAFVAKDKNGVRQLFIVEADVDGRGLKQLTNTQRDVAFPNWHPDGLSLMFSHIGTKPGEEGLYSVWRDGSELKTFYQSDSIPLSGSVWAPDGSHLVAMNRPGGNIFQISLDGKKVKNISKLGNPNAPFVSPRFMEGGKFVVCVRSMGPGTAPQLYKIPDGGGAIIPITRASSGISFFMVAPSE